MSEVRYSIEPSGLGDCFLMAHNMREVDKREIWASHKSRPLESLVRSLKKSSDARTGRVDGEIAIMFGVCPHTLVSDHASIWMLGTDLLAQHSVRFLRECSNGIADISGKFRKIENYCDARNTTTLRWLDWLGFTIEEAQPYGVYEMPFHHFYKEVV